MEITIRDAQPDDVESLVELLQELFAVETDFAALDFYDKMGWCPTQLICLRRQWDLKTG